MGTINVHSAKNDIIYITSNVQTMITRAQLRAARALAGVNQRKLAELSGLSLPTIQRMEASDGMIRGNVDSLIKLIAALNAAGIDLIGEGDVSHGGGRGVRFKTERAMEANSSLPTSSHRRKAPQWER
jgi:transcriptional regulator with XRE-family HTH domain